MKFVGCGFDGVVAGGEAFGYAGVGVSGNNIVVFVEDCAVGPMPSHKVHVCVSG